MPITQPDAWVAPPFEGRLIEQAPFKKVLIGRGATNSKGPEMAQLNALMSIKAVMGKLPVNLIFIAEGDEERMDIGLRKFVRDHPDLIKGATRCSCSAARRPAAAAESWAALRVCMYIELTTSGKSWGRGPVAIRHSWHEQARRRQPGLASHPDAGFADLEGRQHSDDPGLQRQYRPPTAAEKDGMKTGRRRKWT